MCSRDVSALHLSPPVASAIAAANNSVTSQESLAEVALVAAAENGVANDVAQILDAGLVEPDGDLLFLACEHGHGEVVELLLGRGLSPSQCLPDQTTPLYVAAANNHESCVAALVAVAGGCRDVNAPAAFGVTPLLAACSGAREAAGVVSLLLGARADPCKARDSGCTPVHEASSRGYERTVAARSPILRRR